jgi:CHAT domain-containing protein
MKTIKIICFTIFLFCSPFQSYTQIGNLLKDKIKDKVDQQKDKVVQEGKDKIKEKKDDFRDKLFNTKKEFDPSELNYAISLSDNAVPFEAEERFGRVKDVVKNATYKTATDQEYTPLDRAKNLKETGEILYGSNRLKSAELTFREAKLILEKNYLTQEQVYSDVLANLGLVYHTAGRYYEADSISQKAAELRKEKFGEKHLSYAASLNNLAALYKEKGEYTQAEKYIEQCINIYQNAPQKDSIPYAIALNNKAILFQTVGRAKEAEPLQNKALDLVQDKYGGKSNVYLRMLGNLAIMYQDLGRYEDAEKVYKKAITVREKKLGTKHPDVARLKHNLAGLYVITQKYDLVEQNLKDAANIYKDRLGENHPSYAGVIEDLGNFYVYQEKYNDAEPLLTQALTIRGNTLGENHPDYASALESLAILYWKKQQYTQATTHYRNALKKYLMQVANQFPAMSEHEKTVFWNLIQPKFERFYSYVLQASSQDPALLTDMYNAQLLTKALLLNSTSKVKQAILNSNNPKLIALYNKYLAQKEYLARVYTMSKSELSEQKINVDSLEKATNTTEKQLSEQSHEFNQNLTRKIIKTTDIQQAIKDNEAAIEIFRIRHYHKTFSEDSVLYAALILKKTVSNPEKVVLPNGTGLENTYAGYYRKAIKAKLEDEESFTAYWKPIHTQLTGKTHIYVSLDGIYNQISLNGLRINKGKYLIDEYDISIVTNTKEIVEIASRRPQKPNLVYMIGNPDYQMGANVSKPTIKDLPGTKAEIEAIQKLLSAKNCKTEIYLQQSAKEDIIKKVNQPDVLHIATHGFFLANVNKNKDKVFGIEADKAKEKPMLRSGLMFAGAEATAQNIKSTELSTENNGIFTAYEAMSLNLDNTKLVVLSACETGLGEIKSGEGVYGLQRAFQIAGTETLIMSLWKVADEQTKELMTLFYQKWLATNNKHASFIEAQKELKKKYPEPYFWSAFVLVGE